MATDTAELASPRSFTPDPARNAWQIPLFLVGAGVFVCAWQGWLPLGTPDPAADFMRDLAALKGTFEKVKPDREELKELLNRTAGRVDSFPEYSAPARFTIGSGYVRLAELTPQADEARAHWTLAKQHFDRIRAEEIKDANDKSRLAFRAAKARAAVGLPASTPVPDIRLLIALLGNVPFSEEAGEAGRLQAELAMKISPPDLHTAREALTRYLTATGIATPAASLARAKYQLGEIHFRRKEPDLARKWLEQIGSEAPAEIVGPARFLLARVRMAQDDWLGATRDLDAVRTNPGSTPALKLTSAYHLGLCKLNTREWEAAAAAFAEGVKAEAPEGPASAARLADLTLRAAEPAARAGAVDHLALAVKGVAGPTEYRNSLVRLNELRGTFELAFTTLLADGSFEPGVRASELYAAIAEGGREREKRAEITAAWAAALQKAGGDFKPRALAAAEEYKSLVGMQPSASAKADMLRRAAGLFMLGGNPNAAVAVLEDATKLPQLPEPAIGPVWAELANALVAAERPAPEVLKAFNQAMASAGAVSTTTRYRLARQFADSRDTRLAPLARELFTQIAQQESVGPDEREFHERALVELAHEHIRSANFPEAEVWLRKQLALYQTGAEAALGRLLLGVCLIQKSSTPPPSAPDPATATRLRDEALKLFQQIVADAEEKYKRDGKLGERDAWLRLQASLRVLQTFQLMQKPNDLLAEADKLRDRHRGTVEELIVLSLMYHAFKQKKEVGRALQMRDQMKELFDRLPATAFNADKGEYSRTYWEKVWFTPDAK